MYDLTDKKSFEKARYTYNSLFEKFGQIPFVLVGYNSELEPQISQEDIKICTWVSQRIY